MGIEIDVDGCFRFTTGLTCLFPRANGLGKPPGDRCLAPAEPSPIWHRSSMADHPIKECHRYVDMWAAPGLHPTNIEFLQKLKSADTQHFTRGMDVIGTISEMKPDDQWEKSHLIGIRTDVWRPDHKERERTLRLLKKQRQKELKQSIKRQGRLNKRQSAKLLQQSEQDAVLNLEPGDIESRRLVVKLFKSTTSRMRWAGTIEEVTSTEVHNTIGTRRPLLTMVVMHPNSELITYIQENHRTFRYPSVFSFCYFDRGRAFHVSLKQRWVSVGPDFDIHINGRDVGIVDSKLICFGSDSHVDLEDHELAEDTGFMDLLTLFASTVGYHKAMRKSIRKRVRAALNDQTHCHVIEDEEIRLRNNGRAAA